MSGLTPVFPRGNASSSIQAAKRELRRKTLARLRAQVPEERRRASVALHERLFALEVFRRARGVHCYLSLPEEVDTSAVLVRCHAEGKTLFVPYQIPAQGRLGLARWSPNLPLVAGPLGVAEPAPAQQGTAAGGGAAEAETLAAIDLVVVPGVAFDRAGGRLGRGKGYYDKFLKELADARRAAGAGQAAQIALAYPVQVVQEVPSEPWDVRMDMLVTPVEATYVDESAVP